MKKQSFDDLPRDLVELILMKSPASSLSKHRFVCKLWRSIISDSEFVQNHLKANVNENNTFFSSSSSSKSLSSSSKSSIILGFDRQELFISDIFHRNYDTFTVAELNRKQLLSLPEVGGGVENSYLRQRGRVEKEVRHSLSFSHCNGILCLVKFFSQSTHYIVLYNPVLRERRSIMNSDSSFSGYGFGYDSVADDYKFVTIMEPESRLSKKTKAEVYNLGTGSCRLIEVNLNTHCSVQQRGAYLKGRCYWINYSAKNILSFDMSNEKFYTHNLPPYDLIQGNFLMMQSLVARGESSLVCLAHIGDGNRSKMLDIWVMGVDHVWTKQHRIQPCEWVKIKSPLLFWKDDELLVEDKRGYIVTYSLSTGTCEAVNLCDDLGHWKQFISHNRNIIYASSFVESLVSVKGLKKI